MITVTEGLMVRGKAPYGLVISVALREGESLQSEFYQIKDALLDWQRSRGAACGALNMEYQVAESSRQQVVDFWHARIENDHLIQSVFANIGEVELSLSTPDGRNTKKVGFEFRHEQPM